MEPFLRYWHCYDMTQCCLPFCWQNIERRVFGSFDRKIRNKIDKRHVHGCYVRKSFFQENSPSFLKINSRNPFQELCRTLRPFTQKKSQDVHDSSLAYLHYSLKLSRASLFLNPLIYTPLHCPLDYTLMMKAFLWASFLCVAITIMMINFYLLRKKKKQGKASGKKATSMWK